VYVLRQASRRSWRIGQRQPVEVTYFVYQETLQAEALALVAAKMRSALMIEGELPEDGLAALEGDGQDVLLALARRLTQEGAAEAQSLEALFAQAREHETAAEDYLVDGDWDTAAVATAIPEDVVCGDGAAELGHRVLAGEAEPDATAAAPSPVSNGRTVGFEELARLVRRPKPRRRPAPEGQLRLFVA
jgi:hypothetical protein